MRINVEWHLKMQALRAELESVSEVMRDTDQLVHQWVKEYLDERSDQP